MAVVIVALPRADDPVQKVSSEPKAHMTLLYLDDSILEYEEDLLGFAKHVAETSLYNFGLPVKRRDTLGEDDADVLLFEKNWMFKNLEECRNHFLTNPQINLAYLKAPQYPEWTPHLTLGYPDKPAKDVDYPINWVQFDRIAVWTTGDDGPEFYLQEESNLISDTYHDDILEHAFGDFVKKFKESDVVRDARGQFSKKSGSASDFLKELQDEFGEEAEYYFQRFTRGGHSFTDRGRAELNVAESTVNVLWATQGVADNMTYRYYTRPPTQKEMSREIDKKLDKIRDDSWAHAKKEAKKLNPFSHSVFDDALALAHDLVEYYDLPTLFHKANPSLSDTEAKVAAAKSSMRMLIDNAEEIVKIFLVLHDMPENASVKPKDLWKSTIYTYLQDSIAQSIVADPEFLSHMLDEHGLSHLLEDTDYLEHYGVKGMRWGVRKAEKRYGIEVKDPVKWSVSKKIDTTTMGFLDRLGVRMVDRDVAKMDKQMLRNDLRVLNKRPSIEKKDPDGVPKDGTIFRSQDRLDKHLSQYPMANRTTQKNVDRMSLINVHDIEILRDKPRKQRVRGESPYVVDRRTVYSVRNDKLKHGEISDEAVRQLESLSDDELFHYGVKGMRWGYRRAVDSNGYVKGLAKKVGRAKGEASNESRKKSDSKTKKAAPSKSADQIRMENTLKKSLEQMSTREIRELNNRLEAANKLKKTQAAMKENDKSKIRQLANFVLENAKKGATDAAAAQIRSLSGGVVNNAFNDLNTNKSKSGKDKVTDPPKQKKSKPEPAKTPKQKTERDQVIAELVDNVYNISSMPKKRE